MRSQLLKRNCDRIVLVDFGTRHTSPSRPVAESNPPTNLLQVKYAHKQSHYDKLSTHDWKSVP